MALDQGPAQTFLDLLPRLLAQSVLGGGGNVAAQVLQTPPAQAAAAAIADAARVVPEGVGGLAYAPGLTAGAQGQNIAGATGAAHGAFLRQLLDQGPGAAFGAARTAEHAAPEPFPGAKGVLQMPADPTMLIGGPATRGFRAGAEAVGPATKLGRGLLAGATANEAYAGAVAQALGLLGKGAGGAWDATAGRLPGIGGWLEESPWSALQTLRGQAGQASTGLQDLAARGVAPPEAASPFRYLAGRGDPWAEQGTAQALQQRAGLSTIARDAGVDLAQVPDARLKQVLNHGQQDLREIDALRQQLQLPNLSGQAADRPLGEILQAAQAAAPDANPQTLLAQADQVAQAQGLPRVRTTQEGRKTVQELAGTVNQVETTNDVAKALAGTDATPEEIRLAQAQFLADRYGDTFPVTTGTQHQYNAVAQRLAREGEAPVPPMAGTEPVAPPLTRGEIDQQRADARMAAAAQPPVAAVPPDSAVPPAPEGVPPVLEPSAGAAVPPVEGGLPSAPSPAAAGLPPAAASPAEGLPQNVAYHVTPYYDGGPLRAQPFPNSGDPTPLVWLNNEGPIGRLGQVLEVDLGKLDPAKLTTAGSGFPAYAGDIPADAIRVIGNVRPGQAGRSVFVRAADSPIDEAAYQAGLDAGLSSKTAMEQARRYAPLPEPAEGGAPGAGFTMPGYAEPPMNAGLRGNVGEGAIPGPEPIVTPPPGSATGPGVGTPLTPPTGALLSPQDLGALHGVNPDVLQQMQTAAPGIVDRFAKDQATWQSVVQRLGALQPEGPAPTTLAAAADQALALSRAGTVAQATIKPLLNDAKTLLYRYGDTNLADAGAESDALLHAFLQDRSQALGNPQPLSIPVVSTLMQLLRKVELFSGVQPLKRVADAYLHSLAFTGQLGIPDMATNLLRATATGEEAGLGPAAAAAFQQRGLVPPAGLFRTELAAELGHLAGPGTSEATAPTNVRGALGEVGAQAHESVGRLLTGQGFKDAGQWAGSVIEAVSRTASSTARAAGFLQGYDQAAAKQADTLANRLGSIIGGTDGPLVAQAVRDGQGIVAPDLLQTWLQHAGVEGDAARSAFAALSDHIATARQAGMAMADRFSVGVPTLTNLDEALRIAMPFHTFATRSAPRALEMFLTNPWTWRLFQAYHDATQRYDQQEGILPGTALADKVPVFTIGGTKVMLNPLEYLAEDRYFRQPFPSPKATPVGNAYQRLSQVGLGLASPWQKLLETTGALGPAPPGEVTPVDNEVSMVLQALRSQPSPMPWAQLGNARPFGPLGLPQGTIAPGQDTYNPNTETNKRLAELSIEQTGTVNHPDYVAAMNNPVSPLFQEAARQVAQQEIAQSLAGHLGVPLKGRRPTEARIQEAMAGLPQVNAAGGGPGHQTLPTLPYPGAVINPLGIPGFGGGLQPPTTFAQRQAQLADRARTNPYALGYSQAYGEGVGAGAPGAASAYAQMKQQVQQQWTSGTASERQALIANPLTRGFVLDLLIQTSPLFKPQGGIPVRGGSILQDVLPVP